MRIRVFLPDAQEEDLDCDGFEVTRSGALVVYKTTGPGLHQEITHLLADMQWLRVVRLS